MRVVGQLKNANRRLYLNRTATSTLALLVARIGTDDPHHALAPDDLAVATDTFDRSQNFHWISPENIARLLGAEHDTALGKVVRRELHGDLVAGKDANVVHAHFSGDVAKNNMPVFEFDPKRGIREILDDLSLHFNYVFLGHGFSGPGSRLP